MAAVERPRMLKRLLLPVGLMPLLLMLAVAPGRENLADEEPRLTALLEPLELNPPLIRDEPDAPGSDVPRVELEVGAMPDAEDLPPGPVGRLNRERPGENGKRGVASCVAAVLLATEL